MRTVRRLLPALLLLTVAATRLEAQAGETELPARWRSLQRLPPRGSAEIVALLDDLSAGRVDAWALVRQLAPRAEVPPGAIYFARCSAAFGAPTAIFSLGRARSAEIDRSLEGMASTVRGRAPATPQEKLEQFAMMSRVAKAVNTAPGVQEAVDFYRERGATLGTVTLHYPLTWNGDAPGRALHVTVRGRNPYVAGPHDACRDMPTGPIVELSIR